MPGIVNATAPSMENLSYIVNSTSLPEMLVRSNTIIYNGWFWFIMLWVVWVILFVAANKVKDQPLINAMYSGAAISILSLFLRAITSLVYGVKYALVTDHQMWAFPLITICLAGLIWAIKD